MGVKLGERIRIEWTQQVKGKAVKRYSFVPSKIAKDYGLTETKTEGGTGGRKVTDFIKKDSKKRERLTTPRRSLGADHVEVTQDKKTKKGNRQWNQIRVPAGLPLKDAAKVIFPAGKATAIRLPNGQAYEIGS